MKANLKTSIFLVLATGLFLTACKKDKVEENQEEVITTLQLSFVPANGGNALVYKFDDPDGPGGNAPIQEEIVLAPSQVYNVSLSVLNKTTNPVTDVTSEIVEEAAAHRFYYVPGAGSNITVNNFNNDENGVPLGTNSTWTTGQPGVSTLRVILRHYPASPPNKLITDPFDSPKSGTDIDINFVTRIQ